MEAFSGGAFLLLFLQWNRGHACVRWRGLGGFEGAETKPWACCGEGPGNARPSRKSLARMVGRAGAFGSWLSARGFRISDFGFQRGWARASPQQAGGAFPANRLQAARVPSAPHPGFRSRPRPGNRLDFAPALIAAKPLKPCDGGVFQGSFFAPENAAQWLCAGRGLMRG